MPSRLIDIPQITAATVVTTVTDAVLSGASGKQVTISSAGANLPSLAAGVHILVQGGSVNEANSPYRVVSVVTDQEEYILAKLNEDDAVDVTSESMDVEETTGMSKVEAESPELHVMGNTGAFSVQARYSTDGIRWNNGTSVTAVGVEQIAFKIIWIRLFVTSVGTDVDASWAV